MGHTQAVPGPQGGAGASRAASAVGSGVQAPEHGIDFASAVAKVGQLDAERFLNSEGEGVVSVRKRG